MSIRSGNPPPDFAPSIQEVQRECGLKTAAFPIPGEFTCARKRVGVRKGRRGMTSAEIVPDPSGKSSEGHHDSDDMTLNHGPQDGTDPGVPCPQGAWYRIRTFSILAFASPQLEALYQAYQACALNVLTWILSAARLASWLIVITQTYRKGEAYPHLQPPLTLQLSTDTFPAAFTLVMLCFFPAIYSQYNCAVHVFVNVALLSSHHRMSLIPLWLRSLQPSSGASASLLQKLGSFSSENVYLFTMWYQIGSFPMGQPFDHAFVIGTLVTSLARNSATCTSPLWPRPSVTMAPVPHAIAQTLSSVLVQAVGPIYPTRITCSLPCPASLAFWQILGSMLALFFTGAMEVVRRRAFLRTQEARAFLGPSREVSLLTWPFGGLALMGRIFSWLVGVCMVHALILAVMLHAFFYLSHALA